MEKSLLDFISSIQESRLQNSDKKTLIAALQKDGVTQSFADLFKHALMHEAQRRGDAAADIISDFNARFAQLLKQFEKESIALEEECAKKISALDVLDTAGEQNLLSVSTTTLKRQRDVYEKKTRDLTIQLAHAIAKLP